MKLKSLLFASAAGMFVVTGAQAADLPVAEPVEYVRICDAFGTGFFYIPGTETCLKISGYARYEAHFVGDSDIYEYDPFGGKTFVAAAYAGSDNFNNFSTRARGEVQFDARTMTDLGLLRSYIALRGTIGPTNSGGYSDGFNVDKAWLSLANDTGTLTAGHHGSFFDFFGGNAMNTRIGGDDPTTSTNTLAYTFVVGNGVSASVAIEDKWFRRYGIGYGAYFPPDPSTFWSVETDTTSASLYTHDNEGQEVPDFVANIRVDQGWGSAQVMGAVGRVGAPALDIDGDGSNEAGATDEIGWAVGAGL
ncbi:MAG TPA: porin, partial [Afifellaceae bacterium]|nr:porin [Afifellaceae bacterium]